MAKTTPDARFTLLDRQSGEAADLPVALSYGCTCPGGDQHDPNNGGCRYGQVAAVRPTAGSPADLDQAIHAAHKALFNDATCHAEDNDELLQDIYPYKAARVAVEAAWPYAIGSANQHHWKRMATRNMRAFQATRDQLAYVIAVTTPECEICEDDAVEVVLRDGAHVLVCQSCAGAIAAVDEVTDARP